MKLCVHHKGSFAFWVACTDGSPRSFALFLRQLRYALFDRILHEDRPS
jgi:hypothetical protein